MILPRWAYSKIELILRPESVNKSPLVICRLENISRWLRFARLVRRKDTWYIWLFHQVRNGFPTQVTDSGLRKNVWQSCSPFLPLDPINNKYQHLWICRWWWFQIGPSKAADWRIGCNWFEVVEWAVGATKCLGDVAWNFFLFQLV